MAAPPSAGRRGEVHYHEQRRQPKLRGPLPNLPPLPQLLTTAHDSATTGAGPPRAYRVRSRVGTPTPCTPFASRGSRRALAPAGGGSTVPPRPPIRCLSFLFLLLCHLPPTSTPGWRGGAGARDLRRCRGRPTHWRRRAAPPPPTNGAFWGQAAACQRWWPAFPPP